MAVIVPLKRRKPGWRRPRRMRPRLSVSQICVILLAVGFLGSAVVYQAMLNAARPAADTMALYDFANCDEARAAHAAPLVREEPWYRPGLDRDGDGVACEFYLPTAAHDAFAQLKQAIGRWLEGAPK